MLESRCGVVVGLMGEWWPLCAQAGPLGGSVGRLRHPCPFLVVVWLVFVGDLGGIATIGAALRRVGGVSVVYGRKTPRVVAQSPVHLGDMRVTLGFWGVVDDGLGALVRGEAFSALRRVGYVGPQCVLPG